VKATYSFFRFGSEPRRIAVTFGLSDSEKWVTSCSEAPPKGKLAGLLALRLAITSLKLWPDSLKNFKSASAIARGIVPR